MSAQHLTCCPSAWHGLDPGFRRLDWPIDGKGRTKLKACIVLWRCDCTSDLELTIPASVPVTTVPIFLHLQPVLAPLPFAQPSLILSTDSPSSSSETKSPNHLYFIITLHDPTHSIQFVTTTQPSPADWLQVEYERSDWVEERLVEVIRTGVEIVAQDVSVSLDDVL